MASTFPRADNGFAAPLYKEFVNSQKKFPLKAEKKKNSDDESKFADSMSMSMTTGCHISIYNGPDYAYRRVFFFQWTPLVIETMAARGNSSFHTFRKRHGQIHL